MNHHTSFHYDYEIKFLSFETKIHSKFETSRWLHLISNISSFNFLHACMHIHIIYKRECIIFQHFIKCTFPPEILVCPHFQFPSYLQSFSIWEGGWTQCNVVPRYSYIECRASLFRITRASFYILEQILHSQIRKTEFSRRKPKELL